jgi:3-hydroxyisobutyrate dehydrogenase-like beta-hydroxyacid dehydrogenase
LGTASAIHRLGTVGSASAIKLAVNTLYAVQVAACAEMPALLGKQGKRPAQAIKVLFTLLTTSPAL